MTSDSTAVHANGHGQLAPLRLPEHGPVSAWPQAGPGQSRTAADKPERWRRAVSAHRGWLAAVPVVLVNAVAFGAQLGFWHAHVPLLPEAVLVALALESIAVYLAWQAHIAQLADDSALRLRLAAYGMALLIGALNYSHFMLPGWRPTVAAVTFGMMSAISPWLWSVHSRRVSRDALKASDQLEPHAVRLGMTRWTWHPVLSYRVMRLATWEGENRPKAAIALLPAPGMDKQVDKTLDKQVDKRGQSRTALDRAAAAIRDNPHLDKPADKAELARIAGVSAKTIQRARNGSTGSTA